MQHRQHEQGREVAPRKIIRLEITESTNSAALAAGRQGAAAGTVVVAVSQTAGRGRLNRSWLSPPGMGLYFSVILRPALAPQDLAKITMAAGLAVCRVIESHCQLFPRIKWPNDLLLEGRKFGGILCETDQMPGGGDGRFPLAVVGVGLNLYPPEKGFPPGLAERATALSLYNKEKIDSAALLDACAEAIEGMVQRLTKGDFPAILQEWRQRDAIGDRVLTWVTPKGEEVRGTSLGPDAEGMLRIRDEAGTIHTVISGDVKLVGKIPAR